MFDIIIKNGLLCDGTGRPAYQADIGITGNVITCIGTIPGDAHKIIDATGKTVTPGFIDPHTHADQDLLMAPQMEPYLKQGVTTVVTGNCGYGMAPQGDEAFYFSTFDDDFIALAGADPFQPLALLFDRKKAEKAFETRYQVSLDFNTFEEFNRKCDALPLGCNVAPLIGYSAARTAVMGLDCLREASETELKALESVIENCMEAGAFGISTGRDPIYIPGPYATDEEMRRMLAVVSSYDGIFSSHTFNCNSSGQPDRIRGYKEMVRQAASTGIKLNVSHVHVMNMAKDADGALIAAKQTLAYFNQLIDQGVDITYDIIPSPACTDFTLTSFGYFVRPLLLMAGSRKELAEKFKQAPFRAQIYQMVKEGKLPILDENSDTCWFAEFHITKHTNPVYVGQYLVECAENLGLSPLDCTMKIFAEDPDMVMDMAAPAFDQAVDLLCGSDLSMPCSDGGSYDKTTELSSNPEIGMYPNSMNVGYVPRYLNRYGKDNFEKAVRQASGFVAERFGIEKRGTIQEGNFADLVILDRGLLRSFDEDPNPLQDPQGISSVLVNGQVAVENNQLTHHASGSVLRKN